MPEPANPQPIAVTLAPMGAPEAALERIAATSIRHVQLSATQAGMRPRDLDAAARRGLREKLKRLELTVSGIDLWIPVEHFTATEHVDRALGAVRQALELAAELGRVPVSVSLPRPSESAGSADVEVIAEVASMSDRLGPTVADHARPIVRHEVLCAGLDPALYLSYQEDPIRVAATNASRLAVARINDLLRSGMRGPIGEPQEARLDYVPYAMTLAAIGYQRPVIIDTRQWVDPWGGLDRTLRRWNEALAFLPR
jgi:sugar phosphate isomerase/epimerase